MFVYNIYNYCYPENGDYASMSVPYKRSMLSSIIQIYGRYLYKGGLAYWEIEVFPINRYVWAAILLCNIENKCKYYIVLF